VWVAEAGGSLVGGLFARRAVAVILVLRAGVAPAARRRGVASRLVEAALAREPGLARAHLEVRESNVGARAFYAALGFGAVGRRPRHYPDGEAAVVMQRDLPGR
jgi:ribosomal protein S18 acetylase RimI-like enzyme